MADGDGESNFGRRATDSLEMIWAEVVRVRDRQHTLESEIAAMRYLAREVRDLARELHESSQAVERLSRRALERPTASAWSAIISFGALTLAVVAFIVTVVHGH
jgi:predicted RNase H-like nuclease (RuvC/YqgF family)